MILTNDLKNNLISQKTGQSIVEYIVVFIVLTVVILGAFGGFLPGELNLHSAFDRVITGTFTKLNNW